MRDRKTYPFSAFQELAYLICCWRETASWLRCLCNAGWLQREEAWMAANHSLWKASREPGAARRSDPL